ncbi:MAG TPA: hypothetical protein VJ969_05095 [Desulfopila sp.]|nr:hypothetical protein [Desulfopila sp.]
MVYLPIGCVMATFIFALLGLLFQGPGFSSSARHCAVLALIGIIPAAMSRLWPAATIAM